MNTALDTATEPADTLDEYICREEMQQALQRSDVRAWAMTFFNFTVMGVAFALPAIWFNPLTFVLSAFLLGGRQLGMAVLYHDCSHWALFKTRPMNEFMGKWVYGGLMNTSLKAYRDYHMGHHRYAGTEDDPDIGLARTYPATRDSMRRKMIRDFTGQTGFKDVKRQLSRFGMRRNAAFLVSHSILLALLLLGGIGWAYLMWWVGYIFAYQPIHRIRFMGEHGVVRDLLSADPRDNTSTTLVSWWERLFIGPNHVNYHLEHHLKARVPCYNLPRFHELLASRGFFTNHDCLSRGYREVVRRATLPLATAPTA
ncbi:MAG: fatty acid desaturase family protein [Pseudomonadales bacterium]|nr:fatty acid desaturase family protein [Pseudomonadales bacterium]MDP6828117.1 fatty acid desaturase family protein [Pseudomonadales bacterium]MDP6971815.1 fatty acid desaturase family protein [Pseudomonadales bacterium]